MIHDIFVLWTPQSVLVSLLAGAAYGFLQARLRPAVPLRTITFFSSMLFVFWIIPFIPVRLIDADPAQVQAGLRTIGAVVQAAMFITATVITVTLYRHFR